MNDLTPQYLLEPIPMPRRHLFGRHPKNDLYEFAWMTKRFSRSFYPKSFICWNELRAEIRKSESQSIFKSNYIKIIRPTRSSIFDIHNPDSLRYIYQLSSQKTSGFFWYPRGHVSLWQRHWNYKAFLTRLPNLSYPKGRFSGDSESPCNKYLSQFTSCKSWFE